MLKIQFSLLTVASLLSSPTFAATTDASMAKIKVYGVALSTNADCSNAKVVGYNASGTTYDFMATTHPTLFSGTVDPGTYNCMILYMDSLLTFTPTTTTGNCTAGTTYTRNICNGSCTYDSASPDSNNILVYGATGTAASGSNSQDITHTDKVLLFISTGSTGTGQTGNAFLRPTTAGSTNGIKLNGALTVSSTGATGTFVANFTGKVDGGQSPCDLGPPVFSFR